MKAFKKHNAKRNCLLTQAIYAKAEVKDLGIEEESVWKVRQCRPRLRRDQIASGLETLTGGQTKHARSLAARIPAAVYQMGASIEDVIKYCCINYCVNCKGARLHGNVHVKGFRFDSNGSVNLTMGPSANRKEESCQWRLSKRRNRGQDGELCHRSWHSRCNDCSLLQQTKHYHKSNDRAKAKRHKIKQDEMDYLSTGKKVLVNSLDLIAWPLFAKLRKDIAKAKSAGIGIDSSEELRKISVQVRVDRYHTCIAMLTFMTYMSMYACVQVDVGVPSIRDQYDVWPTRTMYYRRHMVETMLLKSIKGRYRRLAWIDFLSGVIVCNTIIRCTVDTLTSS